MKAQNIFLSYPVDELEGFRRMAGFGYLVLAIASFVAMSFFIVHNLLGTEKPIYDSIHGFNWTFGQVMYAFVGVSFSFGFVVFTWFFYQTQHNLKARLFILLVAVLFPMFAEVGQMMNRMEDTRQEQATQSETFKTIQKRVENTGNSGTDTAFAPLIASAHAEKAEAETALAQCVTKYKGEKSRNDCKRKQEQAIAKAQSKIEAYEQEKSRAKTADSSQLAQDTKTLQQLENDEGFLQPIVKLLMGLGLPALLASFTVSLIIIGSIEVAMSFLGGLVRDIKEAMRALGAEVSSPRVKARLRESPIVSSLHATGEVIGAEMMKAQQAMSGQNRPTPSPTPTTPHNPTPSAQPAPAPADPPNLRESGGFKQSEEQREMVDRLARGETYQPRHALTVKEALERVLALVTKDKPKGEKFTALEVKKAYEAVRTLEGESRIPELDLAKITVWLNSKNRPTPSPEPSAEGVGSAEGTEGRQPSAEGLEVAYLEWLGQVRAGRASPTVKPTVRFISGRNLIKGIKEIEALAYSWLDRAKGAGVIKDNPDRGKGKPLYVLA